MLVLRAFEQIPRKGFGRLVTDTGRVQQDRSSFDRNAALNFNCEGVREEILIHRLKSPSRDRAVSSRCTFRGSSNTDSASPSAPICMSIGPVTVETFEM